MATIGGLTIEQKVVTVLIDDVSINTEIDAQAADNWTVTSLTPNAGDVIILFTRTIAAS